MKMHDSITAARILKAIVRHDSIGFCVACGEERRQVEPDARRLQCDCCGRKTVYGAEELLLIINV
jgi:hypothetical protein